MDITRRNAIGTIAIGAVAATVGRNILAADAAAAAPGPFSLPQLPYSFDALEPHIDAQTMQIHHDKHHAAYVQKLNDAIAGKADLAGRTVEELVRDLDKVPEDIRTAVRNHGGGHANHSLFWTSLSKSGGQAPTGDLAKAIDAAFGNFDGMKEKLSKATVGIFGSGWGWLTMGKGHALQIETTPNQDSPLTAGRVPLVGIDVWEHAYYLKYQNKRADYVAAIFNVIDWGVVSERYAKSFVG